jgi:hypothetical protein
MVMEGPQQGGGYRKELADKLNETRAKGGGFIKKALGIDGRSKAENILSEEKQSEEYKEEKEKKYKEFSENPQRLEKKADLERIKSEKAADLDRRESEEKEAINIIIKALLSISKEIRGLKELVGHWERASESGHINKHEYLNKYKEKLALAINEEKEILKSIDNKGLDQYKIVRAMIDSPLPENFENWQKRPIDIASYYLQGFKNITEEQRFGFENECEDDRYKRQNVSLHGGHDDHGWMN